MVGSGLVFVCVYAYLPAESEVAANFRPVIFSASAGEVAANFRPVIFSASAGYIQIITASRHGAHSPPARS